MANALGRSALIILAASILVVLSARSAWAGCGIPICGKIRQVQVETADGEVTRYRVHGTYAWRDGQWGYSGAYTTTRGFLYFSCRYPNTGCEETAKWFVDASGMEWGVGFCGRFDTNTDSMQVVHPEGTVALPTADGPAGGHPLREEDVECAQAVGAGILALDARCTSETNEAGTPDACVHPDAGSCAPAACADRSPGAGDPEVHDPENALDASARGEGSAGEGGRSVGSCGIVLINATSQWSLVAGGALIFAMGVRRRR